LHHPTAPRLGTTVLNVKLTYFNNSNSESFMMAMALLLPEVDVRNADADVVGVVETTERCDGQVRS
jgi:hypothetical protein